MGYPVKLKQEFFKKWMTGLKACTSFKKNNMSIMERKNAIKISADVAMASARNCSTYWSRALISNASKDGNNLNIVQQILGPQSRLPQKCPLPSSNSKICNKMIRCKKILRRSHSVRRGAKNKVHARSIAKRLVKKRTQLLKSLVPGGECMNEVSLIKEALDYIVSLQAQVDVMRCIATASDLECQNLINNDH